jgi:hypothetical protein
MNSCEYAMFTMNFYVVEMAQGLPETPLAE